MFCKSLPCRHRPIANGSPHESRGMLHECNGRVVARRLCRASCLAAVCGRQSCPRRVPRRLQSSHGFALLRYSVGQQLSLRWTLSWCSYKYHLPGVIGIFRALRLSCSRLLGGVVVRVGDLEDVAGGWEIERRVVLTSERASVIAQHLRERRHSRRYRDARLLHLIDRG